MQRDFSSAILDLRSNPVRAGDTRENMLLGIGRAIESLNAEAAETLRNCLAEAVGQPITLGEACADALIAPLPGEDALPLGERSRRLALAMKIVSGGEIEIATEDRDMIKDCVTRYFKGSLIPARVEQLLEAEPTG
jgi:hypothetical protein